MICRKNSYAPALFVARLLVLTAICGTIIPNDTCAGDSFAAPSVRQGAVEQTRFIQIPGPNPIIRPGPDGAWDDEIVEASDAFEDDGTYYFYYHACGSGEGYRLGVASSNHPLGPFKKHGDKPVLGLGPEGSWDDDNVACAMVLEGEGDNEEDEDEGIYYMWYSGCSDKELWSIGLATAEHPLGPWKKYEYNPVLKDFGYLGGVIKVDGKYHLYSAHPIHMPWADWDEGRSRSLTYHGDYSPLAVAIGDAPEGPFKKYPGNPLMVQGNTGEWDDGGISEAEVLYNNGMFHMFYGGTRRFGPRLESIGYAYSFDGFKFYKYGRNPVASRHANPNAAAFAEVHAIMEPPFIYLYHTLRPEQHKGRNNPWVEDLGVQILVTQTPFNLDMPVLNLDSLGPGKITPLTDSPPVSLGNITTAALTAECKYKKNARMPIRLHVRASSDGVNYDTTDLISFDNDFKPGQTARKSFNLNTNVRFIKVLVENPDKSQSVSEIKIIAALSGQ